MSALQLPQDFADLLVCLNEEAVEYMVVGGYAVMAHGYIRATEDLDVWVRATADNAARVLTAMQAFGMPPGLSADVLARVEGSPPTGFRFGRRPLAVDLITSVAGVSFDEVWPDTVVRQFAGVPARVIGRAGLLKNKRASGRPRDIADIVALEALEQA